MQLTYDALTDLEFKIECMLDMYFIALDIPKDKVNVMFFVDHHNPIASVSTKKRGDKSPVVMKFNLARMLKNPSLPIEEIVAHETIHVRQDLMGWTYIHEGKFYWNGKDFTAMFMRGRYDEHTYRLQPWEVEAYDGQATLARIVLT